MYLDSVKGVCYTNTNRTTKHTSVQIDFRRYRAQIYSSKLHRPPQKWGGVGYQKALCLESPEDSSHQGPHPLISLKKYFILLERETTRVFYMYIKATK